MTVIGALNGDFRQSVEEHGVLDVRWGAITDTGLRRERNEDSLVAVPPLFAVADGMGGHQAGDRASSAVVHHLADVHDDVTPRRIYDRLKQASADIAVVSTESGGQSGSTVTGVALVREGNEPAWLVFNIGDSRVYGHYEGRLRQITHDHSLVQDLIDAGRLDPADAERHPARNSITRAIGFHMDPRPDLWQLNIVSPFRLLICSDGLTKELTEEAIERILNEQADPSAAAHALLSESLRQGGRDNISIIVIDSTLVSARATAGGASHEGAALPGEAETALPGDAEAQKVTAPARGGE